MKLLVHIREIPTPEQIEEVREALNRSPHTTLRFAFSQPLAVKPVSDGVKGARAEITVEVGGYWPSDAVAEMKATFFKCGLGVTFWAVGTVI